MDQNLLTNFLVWYLVFLFSTTFHEAMHSFVASYGGDQTARRSGQATLNPLPHIQRSPMGMVVFPIISFLMNHGSFMIGWASAPFNPYWAARYPKRSFLMSLAGPLSHLPLILFAVVATIVGNRTGYLAGLPGFAAPLAEGSNLCWAVTLLLNVVFRLNTVLFAFNLLPIPPLDGSEIWYLFVKREEDRLRYRFLLQSYSLAGLMLAWWAFDHVYYPVLMVFLHLARPFIM